MTSCKEPIQFGESEVGSTFKTSEEAHPIDDFLEACLQDTSNFTTMGMTQCNIDAYDRWEHRMDSISEVLHEVLPVHIRHLFDDSQQRWKEYFEAQNNFSDELFSQNKGTMYIPICAHYKVEVLRERTLLFESLLKEAEM
ncbi:lysozyme inhibitor LprI family protein [Psychroflexus salis]|uniref:Lysozyme inhibitor LprI-like N-terminal domain-containing protein n=1 Tax=Psychroflexus salis TaxID=1526574 RepID=A0A917EAR2_9FLAO|nr:lysozyme inhibitor LprI family protein [Psychroflexus salis]GGE15685.1 hypothetical protein GCM10010831_16240 [Psychroflexus salis]